jgi:hypothetical protein
VVISAGWEAVTDHPAGMLARRPVVHAARFDDLQAACGVRFRHRLGVEFCHPTTAALGNPCSKCRTIVGAPQTRRARTGSFADGLR